MTAVRVGLVGAGRIVERGYVPAFALTDGVELAAIADPVLERCRRVAPLAHPFADVETLLDGRGVDAVIVATPGELHVAHAALAAGRGLPVLVGLVGAGRIVERGYVPAFALTDGVELAAIADPVLERCRRVAPLAHPFADVETLLDGRGVDAVIVATPGELHVAHAALAAGRGLPVLVEKPPAPDLAGARALAAIPGGVWLGLNRRFDPGLVALRGSIGERRIVAVHALFHARAADWGAHVVADDALLDLGPHLIDLVRWLAGAEVDRVRTATLGTDRAVLEVELERGVATVEVDRTAAYREEVEVVLAGGRSLRWRLPAAPAARVVRRLSRRGAGDPLAASLARQLGAFAAAVRGGDPGPLAQARDGVAVMAVTASARASARDGGGWAPAEHP